MLTWGQCDLFMGPQLSAGLHTAVPQMVGIASLPLQGLAPTAWVPSPMGSTFPHVGRSLQFGAS